MRHLTLLLLLALACTACNLDKTYYLETNDARGLETGDKVYRQGVEIGEVTDVSFADDKVRVKVKTESPLFEDQNFRISRNRDGDRQVELGRPQEDAKELSSGETIKDYDFGEDLGQELDGFFDQLGKAFEGREEDFEELGEQLGKSLEGLGEDAEKWGAQMEEWAERFGKDMEDWGEKFGKDMEEWAKELEERAEREGWDSDRIREEIKRKIDQEI